MLQDVKDLTAPGVLKGLNTQYNLLTVQKDQSPDMMDVKVNYDGSIEKRLGSNTMNATVIAGAVGANFSPNGAGTASLLNNIGAWWNLDELNGDRTSQFNSLTLSANNSTVYATGKQLRAAQFIATSKQTLSRASSPYLLAGDSSLSISTWLYLSSTSATAQPIITKRSQTSTGGSSGGITPDSYDVLVCNCDGVGTAFSDSSTTTPKTITPNGNATQLPIKLNKSAGFFNGTTDYVVVPDSADWDFGTGDYNVEFLFNFTVKQTCDFIGFNTQNFRMLYDNTNLNIYQAGSNRVTSSGWTPVVNTWYHIRVRRVSGTTTLYIDGSSNGTPYAGSDDIQGGTTGVTVGKDPAAAQFYLSGWMKELRIIKGASTTVTVPTAQYTTASEANTVLLMHFDTPATSPLRPAIYFDGTGDYLTVPNGGDFDVGTGDFAIDFSVFLTSNANAVQTIFDSGYADNKGISVAINTQDELKVYLNGADVMPAWTLPILYNRWNVIRVERTGGNIKAFLNGIVNQSIADATNITANSAVAAAIGARADASTPLSGYLKELRFSNVQRGAGANYAPSQSGFTVDANTKLYIKGDEDNGVTTFIDSETTPKTVTTAGNTVIKYTEDYRSCIFKDDGNTGHFPYSQGSAKVDFFAIGAANGYFPSTGDNVTTPHSTDFDFGTGTWHIGYWMRRISVASAHSIITKYSGSTGWEVYENGTIWRIYLNLTNLSQTLPSESQNLNTWQYLEIDRNSNTLYWFFNGTLLGTSDATGLTYNGANTNLIVGGGVTSNLVQSLMDNIRISKGTSRNTATFNPTVPSGSGSTVEAFEYSLYVNSSNIVQFDVSSFGLVAEGSVMATSFGALTTSDWVNVIAYYYKHATSGYLGITVNGLHTTTASYVLGVTNGSAQLTLGGIQGNTASYLDGRIDMTGVWNTLVSSSQIQNLYNSGSGNHYVTSFEAYPWAAFDFGASAIRWLTCAAGTGLYASSNFGVTWTQMGTGRTATYQYLDRSKNVLIATSDGYDPTLYWAGSVGTQAQVVGNSAPNCKYSINFQGFLILLNSSTRKRSFNYIDENFQLSSTAWLNFDMPSSADDEVTGCFILRRYLYVSTKYRIYRVSYVGGNPDWQYVEVKNWGFIPRTVKKIVITNAQPGNTAAYTIGEVVIGLTWDRKLRIFDGSGDQILSNNIEKDNGMCDFALDKISYLGSGPVLTFAELDPIPNVYKLCVAIGANSQQTTHFINYDGRCQALYPYSNMKFNCMCVAESANMQYLMAFDRSGYCHMMDSGNLDGNTLAINEHFDSPLMYEKTPSQSSKGHKTDLYFSETTSGTIFYKDRTNFSNTFKDRRKFVVSGCDGKVIHFESVDVPDLYNTYQFRVTSSSSTTDPWRLQRYDHFTKGLGIGRAE